MNDLESWKIWAITAVLVCAILGTTAARVRPLAIGESMPGAAAENSSELSANVSTPSPDSTADLYEAYSSYNPHGSYSDAGYAPVQSSAIISPNGPLYGSGASSSMLAADDQEPVEDVTQQILGNQDSPADLVAINDGTHYANLPLFFSVSDQTGMTDLATDQLDLPPLQDDLAFNTTFDVVSPAVDSSGSNEARMVDLALRNTIVNVAINGSDSNSLANVELSLRSDDPNVAAQSLEIASQAVNPVQNLAMSGELDEELGDEQELDNEAQTQALRAEDQYLAQAQAAEAQMQQQAAMQQRAAAKYTTNGGKMYLQINGNRFTVQPQE